MVGTGMLWVGWYGFNAGSAVAADGIAANAFMTTTLATAVAATVWPLLEWITRGKPTVLGFCSGAVAGLVVITPAAGFVTASGAVIIGVLAGVVPFLACTKLKAMLQLRRRAGHLRRPRRRRHAGRAAHRLLRHARGQRQPEHEPRATSSATPSWLEQLKAIGLDAGAVGRRHRGPRRSRSRRPSACVPRADAEEQGLDQTDHGEAGYHFDEARAARPCRPRRQRSHHREETAMKRYRSDHQAVQARRRQGTLARHRRQRA